MQAGELSHVQARDPRALELARELVDVVGLVGPGRLEVEVDEDGRVKAIWRHEKTPADGLARFDAAAG